MQIVPPLYLIPPSEDSYRTDSSTSMLLWSTGCSVNSRNIELMERCVRYFKRKRLTQGEIICKKGLTLRHIFLILSGECRIGSVILGPGNWIGLNTFRYGYPEQSDVVAESHKVVLFSISQLDFKQRIPKEITNNLERRIRAVARLSACSFAKAICINQSVMATQRDPRAPPTARLISSDVLLLRKNHSCLQEALSTTRSRIHDFEPARV